MNKNKGFIGIGLILAIVLGIVIVGGGAYYLGKNSFKQGVTKNLKEYQNKLLGISFKYDEKYGEVKEVFDTNKTNQHIEKGVKFSGTLKNLDKIITLSGVSSDYMDDIGEGPQFLSFKGYVNNENQYGQSYINPNGIEFRYKKETGIGETEDSSYWADYEVYYLKTKSSQFPGLAFYSKSNSDLKSLVDSIQYLQTNTTTPQNVVKASTNIIDPKNPNMMIYTSANLGIQFTYPKEISFTGGSSNKPLPTITQSISVTENGHSLNVSAGQLGSGYAEIYHKNTNETFEQSILRQVVKPEYWNNPCKVVKTSTSNYYYIDYPGAPQGDYQEDPNNNMQKCGGEFYAGQFSSFSADLKTGGFYIVKGAMDPAFESDDYSSDWWPNGIKFIK
ncbi:MAG TPA: hypothetical protein VMR49_01155 [Candidatus Paceibacterota bacterium]|nr:hypothetical protein [Candidatus Paceibacterota bacterium]